MQCWLTMAGDFMISLYSLNHQHLCLDRLKSEISCDWMLQQLRLHLRQLHNNQQRSKRNIGLRWSRCANRRIVLESYCYPLSKQTCRKGHHSSQLRWFTTITYYNNNDASYLQLYLDKVINQLITRRPLPVVVSNISWISERL